MELLLSSAMRQGLRVNKTAHPPQCRSGAKAMRLAGIYGQQGPGKVGRWIVHREQSGFGQEDRPGTNPALSVQNDLGKVLVV